MKNRHLLFNSNFLNLNHKINNLKSFNIILKAERIKERQDAFLKKEAHTPLVIFPEGTVTSGKHILKFKRGKEIL